MTEPSNTENLPTHAIRADVMEAARRAEVVDTTRVWTNPKGYNVPDQLVKPLDKLRHSLVYNAVAEAKELQRAMRDFKAKWLSEAQAFVGLAAAEYQTNLGGVKGNLTLRTFDGLMEMTVQVADRLTFDERLKVAEALVGECLAEWSANARPELKAIVERAFKTDKEGNVSTGAVLELRRLDIADDRWKRAMDAISDAIQLTGTATYLRFYERPDMGAPAAAISLDLAKL